MKAERCRLGRETLSFLAASAALSAVLYNYFASQPLRLRAGDAVSTDAGPTALCVAEPSPLPSLEPYLKGDRATPFKPLQPGKRLIAEAEQPMSPVNVPLGAALPPKGGPGPGTVPVTETTPKPGPEAAPEKSAADLRFVGTVFVGNKSCALLRPRDGDRLFRLRLGDAIPEYGCTVTHIGKQAIHLAGQDQQTVVIGDGR
ncbi:MAG: hypothetical protein ABSE73_28365 [Planctomycetota bacterium]